MNVSIWLQLPSYDIMFVYFLHSRGNVFKLTAVIYLRQMPPSMAPQLPLSCLLHLQSVVRYRI